MDKPQFDNERKGVMFLKGSENPNAPKWSGKMTLGGVEYQIAAWEKMSRSGKEMLTISITDKPAGGSYANSPRRDDYPPSPALADHNKAKANAYQKQNDDDGDGIPF